MNKLGKQHQSELAPSGASGGYYARWSFTVNGKSVQKMVEPHDKSKFSARARIGESNDTTASLCVQPELLTFCNQKAVPHHNEAAQTGNALAGSQHVCELRG